MGGREWIARAAHLKKPHWGFFARRTIRRVDAVRIHPLYEFSLVTKQNLSALAYAEVFWWARVDSNHRS